MRNYSFLRILQIFEAAKYELNGSVLDLGGNDYKHNISYFFKGNYKIKFADKFPKNNQTLKIDLEEVSIIDENYNNICLMNVLEHIKNYKNVLKLSHDTLETGGKIIGTVPFLFKIHYSPNDYFRFSEQLLKEELNSLGFKNIQIKPLSCGLFTNIYSQIFDFTKKIPLFNVFLIILFLILDNLFFLLNKNYKKNYPLGYFFSATKN